MKKGGLLLIVSGPSGVGKSSLCGRLLEENEQLKLSISYTTRAPRGQEVNGEHYHFVSRETFLDMVAQGKFAEHAEVHGNFYGTSRATVEEAFSRGEDLLFDIDYQGSNQLKAAFPEASCAVLLLPPSMEVLEARLRGRGTDAEDVIERRMAAATHEMEQFESFDYAVVNEVLEEAYQTLHAVYISQHALVSAQRQEIRALLKGV